jgi:general secretion pathway protein M
VNAGLPTNRFVALALLVFLSVAAFQLIVAPLLAAYPDVASRIEQSQALLHRYRGLSAERPQLSARLESVKDALANNVAYLKGPSDTLAGAELQNQVRSIVEDTGGELHSSQVLPVRSIDPEILLREVGLKFKVLVEIEGLQDLLYELETAQPWMFIEDITILRKESQLSGGAGTNPMLEVTFEVYGFLA